MSVEEALFAPVVSITSTKRRRFFWAAWWSGPPVRVPFRKPDASDGGAATFEEAVAAANARAGTTLAVTDPLWARAWMRVLRGEEVWPSRADREPRAPRARAPEAEAGSIWSLLGVTKDVTLAELKAAYRRRAIELHPDRGGDAETFRRLLAAYEEAQKRVARPRPRRSS
ncbi:MAG: J domain-containing protein [Labilithrix sp.]|nr:J domain-containing protein [Labilithrix sp.]MCW5816148.1 J domain-containing protein [Labilithrix sp.]